MTAKTTTRSIMIIIATLALAACGTHAEASTDITECVKLGGNVGQCVFTMTDTRRVTCLVLDGMREAAMSCDWAHVDGADNL